MKKLIYCTLALAMIAFAACSKDDSSNNNQQNQQEQPKTNPADQYAGDYDIMFSGYGVINLSNIRTIASVIPQLQGINIPDYDTIEIGDTPAVGNVKAVGSEGDVLVSLGSDMNNATGICTASAMRIDAINTDNVLNYIPLPEYLAPIRNMVTSAPGTISFTPISAPQNGAIHGTANLVGTVNIYILPYNIQIPVTGEVAFNGTKRQ